MSSQRLDWLLEPNNPSVRYYALRYLLDRPPNEADVVAAQQAIMVEGPVPQILALQNPGGWWCKPEDKIGPMYQSTVWQLMFLADLHADSAHPQIKLGREHVFGTMQKPGGDFYDEPKYRKQLPSDACCFEGQITWAMLCLTPDGDPRLAPAMHYLARQIVERGFVCRYNDTQACAWGASKILRALAAIPAHRRTLEIQAALQTAVDFILDGNLAEAGYPTKGERGVNKQWFEFGFPRGFQSDVLETLWALAEAGFAADPRARPALELVLSKRKPEGHWCLDNTPKQMLVPLEKASKRLPSKWITLRALRVLKQGGMIEIDAL
jgi:hypothetical protein